MKVLLLSDSHGNIYNIHRAINKFKDTDLIVHLGDCVRDILQVRDSYKNIKFEYVPGNNDWAAENSKEKIIDIEGLKILVTHGHIYNVKFSLDSLISKGKAIGADGVFFGHTHITEEIYKEGMLLLNPGSIGSSAHTERPTFCRLDIEDGKIKVKFNGVE